jgi:hypothetical protein
MPVQNPRRGRQAHPRRKPRSRPPLDKSLLILECDVFKLATQGLDFADQINATTSLLSPDARIAVVKACGKQDLLRKFAALAEADHRFRSIVVIGHSNVSGIKLASDLPASWDAFATWLRPFAPSQLILAACKSGELTPVTSMFAGLPTLQNVYAPPHTTTKQQVQAIMLLLPHLMNSRTVESSLVRVVQFGNFLLTRGLIVRWRRSDFGSVGIRTHQRRSRH